MKSTRTELSRRDFLKTTAVAGAGLTLSFTIPGGGAREASAAAAFEPNATLTITPDGIITVHSTKAEMGQGVGTALAQIVAEELEADWKDVRIDYPMNDPKYGLMLTGGSWSVNWTFDSLSRAGAGARMLLTEAAAKQMNVAVADCVAEDGRIRHLPTGRSMPYGEIVARVPITRTLSEEDLKKIELKKPSQYRIVGKWIPRLDIPEKVTGKAKFGIDTFLRGADAGIGARVPGDPERVTRPHRVVVGVRHHGHHVVGHDRLDPALHLPRPGVIDGRMLAPLARRGVGDLRVDHPRKKCVDPELRLARHLLRDVQARDPLPDDPVLARLLELDLLEVLLGEGPRDRDLRDDLSVRHRPSGREVPNPAVLGDAVRDCHVHLLGGGLGQEHPRPGARAREGVERPVHRPTPAGEHQPVFRVVHRVVDANVLPVGFQLLGDDLGERGADALAHLRLRDVHGDDPVRRDREGGVRLERRGRRCLASAPARDGEAQGKAGARDRSGLQKVSTAELGPRALHGLYAPRGALDRALDAQIRGAAADVAGQRGHDLLVGRVGALRQERRRLHDLARLAVAALRHLLGDPRLLEGMLPLGVEPLDRRDLLSGGLGEGRLARPHRRAVEVDGARAALGDPAAELGAGQLQPLADDPQERCRGIGVDHEGLAVDQELSHTHLPGRGHRPRGQAPCHNADRSTRPLERAT